ncbi:MAG: type II toxin-antitoxin system RelE/ParE family toxin [Pseudomonadota bacterium]
MAKARITKSASQLAVRPAAGRKRAFKTKWFAKEARLAGISDADLCEAVAEIWQGKADDLGGGVWKKRLNNNQDRSIILAKGKRYWIYACLFSKNDQANIDDDELAGFNKLAKIYERLTDADVANDVLAKKLNEICHDC